MYKPKAQMVSSYNKDNVLKKLEKLMERLIWYRGDKYQLTILKGKDRRAYKKDVRYVEQKLTFVKENRTPILSKKTLLKLNKVWKKYKPKEYVSHA